LVDDDDASQARPVYLRDVAARLRAIADGLPFDPRRRKQLIALAAGFERYAERLEREELG
jgi:hypothetical protein